MNITLKSQLAVMVKLYSLFENVYKDKASEDFQDGFYNLISNITNLKQEEITVEQWDSHLLSFLNYTKSEDWMNGYHIALSFARHFEPEYPYDIYAEED